MHTNMEYRPTLCTACDVSLVVILVTDALSTADSVQSRSRSRYILDSSYVY